jgi:hypothetical protein
VVDVTKDEDVKVLNVEESKDETNNMEGQDSMDKGNEVADDSKGKQRTMVLARGVFGTVEMFSRGTLYIIYPHMQLYLFV